MLIYPGHHDGTLAPAGSPADITVDGPIPSYRLKAIRAGLQDWALFKLAESRGFTNYARSEVARVYGQLGRCEWGGCPAPVNGQFLWLTDAVLMDQVRHNIAMKILGISNVAPIAPTGFRPAAFETRSKGRQRIPLTCSQPGVRLAVQLLQGGQTATTSVDRERQCRSWPRDRASDLHTPRTPDRRAPERAALAG